MNAIIEIPTTLKAAKVEGGIIEIRNGYKYLGVLHVKIILLTFISIP